MPKNNKSRSYPQLNLMTAIDIVTEGIKLGKSISRETLAGIGRKEDKVSVKSGSFTRKMSALYQYGLIDVKKAEIKFTDITKEIVFPTEEDKKNQSILQAFLSPNTFYELYTKLAQDIPISMNLLRNTAQKDLGITSAGVNKFINNFIESGILAGVIKYTSEDRNAIQITDKTAENKNEITEVDKTLIQNPQHLETKVSINTNNVQSSTLTFSKGKATIYIEGTLTEKDIKRLKTQIEVFAEDSDNLMEE